MKSTNSEYHQGKSAIEQEMDWIKAAQKDIQAFAPLYDKYYVQIFRYVDRRTLDRDLSADLTSKVFVKAIQAIQTFKPQGVPFGSWLYRIAYNTIQQYFRDAQKERSVSLDDHQLVFLTEDNNDDEEEKPQLISKVKKILDGLKDHEISIIEMRFFEGLSFKEIGDILDITENNAKVKAHRIIEKMRKKLKY